MSELTALYALAVLVVVSAAISTVLQRSWRKKARAERERFEQRPSQEPLAPELMAATRKAARTGMAIQDRTAAIRALDGWERSGGFHNPVIAGLTPGIIVMDVTLAAAAILLWWAGYGAFAILTAVVFLFSMGMWLYRLWLRRKISRSINATRRLHGLE